MDPGSSPYNDAKRYFPILNDLMLWRKLGLRSYTVMSEMFGNQLFDYNKYHLNVFSSTDLLKGSCEDEIFESKVKCIEGEPFTVQSLPCKLSIETFDFVGYAMCGNNTIYLPLQELNATCQISVYSPLDSSEASQFRGLLHIKYDKKRLDWRHNVICIIIIIDFNNEKHTIIFTDFKRFNKTHFWSESRQNWLNPTNELDQAVGAIEHGTFLAVSRVSIRDYLLNFIQEYLFYNEVLSDINGELFNSKARDSDNIFFSDAYMIHIIWRTSCTSPEIDHRADCICRPRKIRKAFILIIISTIFIAITIYLRELHLQFIKILVHISSQFLVTHAENTWYN